jgi:CheY-like chemotaxis protein/HPt (histidine-containing phosphotransfer) domain-containing protein
LYFILYIDPAVPQKVVGDAGRITQILYNLVNNALKFTEHGEILVSVEVLGWRHEAVDIEFSVMDTGVGITQDVQAKIFDAFVQADVSTTRNYGGTGLGLSICRQLAELMRGTIDVSSQAGVGSTFTVCIPFDTETGSISGPRYRDISGAVQGLVVLVVDDNDATCRVLNKMLTPMGFGVHIALSGARALLLLEELKREGKTVDVAIVDKDMPDMNGLETIGMIRRNHAAVAHVLLMVTVTDTVEFLKQDDLVRIDGMLTKPLSPSALLDGIVGCYGKTASVRGGKDFYDTNLLSSDKIVDARILLVEDHEINRQVAVELLEKAGAKVVVVENGQRALDLLESGQEVDLVLMDIQMPVMDGLTATRKIRLLDRPGMNKLPILAMTANAMTGDREKSHEAGMNGHIAKPIDPVLLYATIEKWLPARESDAKGVDVKSKVSFDGSWAKWAPIAGVDVAAGIDRLGGNEVLYAQLLQKLCVNYADATDTVKKLIELGEIEEVRHIVHAVKGVASNLSATAMAESAARLEQVLLEKQADSSEELHNFCEMLDALTNAIFLSLGANSSAMAEPAPVIGEEVSAEALEELLDELKRELQQLRPRPSKELLVRIKTFRWQPSQREQLAAISRHVETYRFETAETLLEAFRSPTEKRPH